MKRNQMGGPVAGGRLLTRAQRAFLSDRFNMALPVNVYVDNRDFSMWRDAPRKSGAQYSRIYLPASDVAQAVRAWEAGE